MKPSAAFSSVVERVRVRGAMSPILWLVGTLAAMSAVTAFSSSPLIQYVSAGCLIICVFVALYAFLRLIHLDPDRLQSETYQLENKRLTLMGDERHPVHQPSLSEPKVTMVEAMRSIEADNAG